MNALRWLATLVACGIIGWFMLAGLVFFATGGI